ncbi:unnamed protein product [Prorocentrum cordatum]|uniref:Uncharacterized protein n=1 Tax=Prorocentrum cordatum TaxID=2364126 RepID=A0ABN9VBC2_9DINO|nr:unnamed protein product [Polarella glacialis]
MPRGQCPRRGPVGDADTVGLAKALDAYVEANVDENEDGCVLRLFDLGEYMQRAGAVSNKNPPKLRTLAKSAEVLKMLARFSARGDGNVKHDEPRKVFAGVLSGRSSATYFRQGVQQTADMLSNKYRLMISDVAAALNRKNAFKGLFGVLPDRVKSSLTALLSEMATIRDLRHQAITDGLEEDYDLGGDSFGGDEAWGAGQAQGVPDDKGEGAVAVTDDTEAAPRGGQGRSLDQAAQAGPIGDEDNGGMQGVGGAHFAFDVAAGFDFLRVLRCSGTVSNLAAEIGFAPRGVKKAMKTAKAVTATIPTKAVTPMKMATAPMKAATPMKGAPDKSWWQEPLTKARIVNATSPKRTYIVGATKKESKTRLVAEITEKQSKAHSKLIHRIAAQAEKL